MKNITISEFVWLAFKYVVYQSENPKECWFPDNRKALYSKFFELRQKYQDRFPVLDKMHFAQNGAFPYSKELTRAIDNMALSGDIIRQYLGNDEDGFRTAWSDDSEKVIKTARAEIFTSDSEEDKYFSEFVRDLSELRYAA